MAHSSDEKVCATCKYWVGERKITPFNEVEYGYNTPGKCSSPGSAIELGGYWSNRGACSKWYPVC